MFLARQELTEPTRYHVSEGTRKKELDVVISNSFGFGGANTTLVLKRYED
ncbi:MAG TPA: hypothetical protein VF092_15715 [Longimicrobium sp.]